MAMDTTPDTKLIQDGVIVSKRNEKYLKRDSSGIWQLNFRVPARFGGKLIRQSLFTEDFDVASSIRDRFVVPILALSSGIAALEEIGKCFPHGHYAPRSYRSVFAISRIWHPGSSSCL